MPQRIVALCRSGRDDCDARPVPVARTTRNCASAPARPALPEVDAVHLVDDLASVFVRLPMQRVAASASVRTGLPAANFHFTTITPLSPPMALLLAVDDGVRPATTRGQRGGCQSTGPAGRRPVVTTAIAVFPNTTMTINYLPGQARRGPRDRTPGRRVHRGARRGPVDSGLNSRSCEVSQRALQVAFSVTTARVRWRSAVPSDYARRTGTCNTPSRGRPWRRRPDAGVGPTPGGSPRRTARRNGRHPDHTLREREYRHRQSRTADPEPRPRL